MVAFAEPLEGAPESLRPAAGPLAWIASQAGKPGRGPARSWIAHARPDWSPGRPEAAPALMLAAMAEALERRLPPPLVLDARRWPHALVLQPLGRDFLLDRDRGLGVCGDWCLGPRVEAAFLSGLRLGEALAA
jgi:predicted NAD/FAD-dependent oxidoreductase